MERPENFILFWNDRFHHIAVFQQIANLPHKFADYRDLAASD